MFYYSAEMISKRTRVQIQTVLRQIVSSVSYLPTLEQEDCKLFKFNLFFDLSCISIGTFKVLVYTDKDTEVPALWEDDEPCLIPGGGEHVRLKSVSTLVHNVDSFVAYKYEPF